MAAFDGLDTVLINLSFTDLYKNWKHFSFTYKGGCLATAYHQTRIYFLTIVIVLACSNIGSLYCK
ncbi:hypothetical protein SPPR111872_15335 [Sphingobacterium prati]